MIEKAGRVPGAWTFRARRWLHTNLWLLAPRIVIAASLVLAAILLWGIHEVARGADDSAWLRIAFIGAFALHGGFIIRRRGSLEAAPDEREKIIDMSAAGTAGCVVTVLAALWAWLLEWFADRGMWFPRQPHEWKAIGTFIIGGFFLIANLTAAWMTPPYAAELVDEDS